MPCELSVAAWGECHLKVRYSDWRRKQVRQLRLPIIGLLSVFIGIAGFIDDSRALELDTLINKIQVTYDRMQALTANFEQVATLKSINRQQFRRVACILRNLTGFVGNMTSRKGRHPL